MVALRVTEYDVPCFNDDIIKATVGWHGHYGSYWFYIERIGILAGWENVPDMTVGEEYYSGGGPPSMITNVFDLVERTWHDVDWKATDPNILLCLRDDPIIEASAFAVADLGGPVPMAVVDYLNEVYDPVGAAAQRSRRAQV